MKVITYGAAALLILFAPGLAGSTCAFAQESFSQGSTIYNTAPMQSQTNFKGDARSANLYKYKNPTAQIYQPWDTFQQGVKQLAAQANTAPTQVDRFAAPDSAASGSTGGYNSGISIFAVLSGVLLNSKAALAGKTGPAAGSSETGIVPPVSIVNAGTMPATSSPGAKKAADLSVNGTLQPGNVPGLIVPQ